jgi:hypothetical protein
MCFEEPSPLSSKKHSHNHLHPERTPARGGNFSEYFQLASFGPFFMNMPKAKIISLKKIMNLKNSSRFFPYFL